MKPPYSNKLAELLGFTHDESVEIYTKQSVFWFSLLFNPIFGGVLLMQNLRDVGYKKQGTQVLLFSIVAFLIPLIVIRELALNPIIVISLNFIVNIPTSFILTDYFFVKYFPESNYFPKNVVPVFLRFILVGLAAAFVVVCLGIAIFGHVK